MSRLQPRRVGDMLARYGGDEFALILPDSTVADAELLAERLRGVHPTGFTVGFTAWTPGEDLMIALDRADCVLYRGKRHDGPATDPENA